MAAVAPPAPLPAAFARAVATLRDASLRPEVSLEEAPAPQRLAPYAVSLALAVDVADEELATGRLVVLHDPAPPPAWEGDTRLVAYLRCSVEPELATDPFLAGVGWSWLTESLEQAGAAYRAAGGTLTRVQSEGFGSLAGPLQAQLELRASWTPADEDLSAHLRALADTACLAAGLPPADGAVPLSRPAARRPR